MEVLRLQFVQDFLDLAHAGAVGDGVALPANDILIHQMQADNAAFQQAD